MDDVFITAQRFGGYILAFFAVIVNCPAWTLILSFTWPVKLFNLTQHDLTFAGDGYNLWIGGAWQQLNTDKESLRC